MYFKKITLLMFMSVVFVFLLPSLSQASTPGFNSVQQKVSQKCKYNPQTEYGKFIPYQTGNCLLTNVALELEVPAEIVKAVATKESIDWQQFKNGEPILSGDGGIGIMQITVYPAADEENLKENAIFNIYSGVKRLKDYLTAPVGSNQSAPLVQKDDPAASYLERWYFSALRYNGIKPENSPLEICEGNGERNSGAYQEELYELIKTDNGKGIQDINTKIALIDMLPADFTYTCNTSENITFNKTDFKLNAQMTETKHLFNKNDTLITFNEDTAEPKIRQGATGSSPVVKAGKGIVVKPTGEFVYDSSAGSSNHFVWYPVQVKDSQTKGYVASSYLKRILTRLEGASRYHTAAEISKEGWKQSDTVVLATGRDFPDALSGTPLAAKYHAPLLLIDGKSKTIQSKNNLPAKQEITRLGAKKVIILGGNGAIPLEVEGELRGLGLSVTRISGSNRFETSAKIAENLPSTTAIVATGRNFPDAISVAAYASKKGYPILLSEVDTIPEKIKKSLTTISKTVVIGGENAISAKVFNELKSKNAIRISGKNRYETSIQVAQQLKLGQNEIFTARGDQFPDALSGAVLASKNNASVLLVNDTSSKTLIDKYQAATILGGQGAVNADIEKEMINLLKN
ncbi:MAG: cell wall-binding repeat-containing protein [Bacillota bacterium]